MSCQATIVGRTGTVLISVGLALLLVSLIPAGQQEYPSSGDQYLAASNFQYSGFFLNLNPQRGIHANITTDRELRVCVFGNTSVYISNWISTHLPDPSNYTAQWETFMLDAFLGRTASQSSSGSKPTSQPKSNYASQKNGAVAGISTQMGSSP